MSAEIDPEPIHTHFGLTYANYLVVQRTLLQSMPQEWQAKFVAMLDDLQAAFAHIDTGHAFEVIHGEDEYLTDLTPDQAARVGYTIEYREDCTLYHDRDGNEIDEHRARVTHVVWPTPDPVPHYERGRARVEPRLP